MRSNVKKVLLFLVFFIALGAVLVCIAYANRAVPVYVVQKSGVVERQNAVTEIDSSEKLNINLATAEELEALPEIGPVLAERIIAYREEVGAFYDVGELRRVEGIGDKTLQNLLPYICT